MKNQYFGDRRHLLKYDLLADLAGRLPDSRLVSIPMLTPNDDSGEGGLTGTVGASDADLLLMLCVMLSLRALGTSGFFAI
jgi:hypothetical protein